MTLFQTFNQNSFVVSSGVVLVVAALLLLARKARRAWLVWEACAGAAAMGWFALRTTDGLHLEWHNAQRFSGWLARHLDPR